MIGIVGGDVATTTLMTRMHVHEVDHPLEGGIPHDKGKLNILLNYLLLRHSKCHFSQFCSKVCLQIIVFMHSIY